MPAYIRGYFVLLLTKTENLHSKYTKIDDRNIQNVGRVENYC